MNSHTHIRLPANEVKSALVGLGKVIPSRPSKPELGCIHCAVKPGRNGKLLLTATHDDTFLECSIDAEVLTAGEDFLLPLKEFRSFVKASAAKDTIVLEAAKTGKVSVTIDSPGNQKTTQLSAPEVDKFPAMPRLRAKAIPFDTYARDSFLQAMACSSSDPTRYVLQGICIAKGQTFVGTDGRHLLHCNSMSLPVKGSPIIPHEKVFGWSRVRQSDDWQLSLNKERYCLQSENWKITGKLIDGNYPNYQQVMPDESAFRTSLTMPSDILDGLASTIRQLPGAKLDNKPVGLEITKAGLSLLTRADATMEFTATQISGATVDGPDLTVFVNREYLAKALGFGLNRIDLIDDSSPLRVRCGESGQREMILMPIRQQAGRVSNPPRTRKTDPTGPKPESPMKTNDKTPRRPAPDPEPSPLELALDEINEVKTQLRQALSGMTSLATHLRRVKADQKSTEKEVRQVRSTLRSLQKVEL